MKWPFRFLLLSLLLNFSPTPGYMLLLISTCLIPCHPPTNHCGGLVGRAFTSHVGDRGYIPVPDRPKSLKYLAAIVTTPLQNARHRVWVPMFLWDDHINGRPVSQYVKNAKKPSLFNVIAGYVKTLSCSILRDLVFRFTVISHTWILPSHVHIVITALTAWTMSSSHAIFHKVQFFRNRVLVLFLFIYSIKGSC